MPLDSPLKNYVEPIELSVITKTVQQLDHLRSEGLPTETNEAKLLTASLESVFEKAKQLNPDGDRSPKESLFYLLWKGNQITLEDNLSAEAIADKLGDPKEYTKAVNKEFKKLSLTNPSINRVDVDAISHLNGMLDYIDMNTSSIPNDTRLEILNLSRATASYAMSVDTNRVVEPMENGIVPVLQSFYRLSGNAEEFFPEHDEVYRTLSRNFDITEPYQTINGASVIANLMHDVLTEKPEIRMASNYATINTQIPSVDELSGFSLDEKKATADDFYLVMGALKSTFEGVKDKPIKDTIGNDYKSSIDVVTLKARLEMSLDSLEKAHIDSRKSYKIGLANNVYDKNKEVDNQLSL